MNILRNERHKIFGMLVNKISLSPFDSKRCIADDGVHTNAFGYAPPPTDAELEEIEEYLAEIFHEPTPEAGIETIPASGQK